MIFIYLLFGPIRKPIFSKTSSNIFYHETSEFFEVKLSKIKISFNTTRMQILRHVTHLWQKLQA